MLSAEPTSQTHTHLVGVGTVSACFKKKLKAWHMRCWSSMPLVLRNGRVNNVLPEESRSFQKKVDKGTVIRQIIIQR